MTYLLADGWSNWICNTEIGWSDLDIEKRRFDCLLPEAQSPPFVRSPRINTVSVLKPVLSVIYQYYPVHNMKIDLDIDSELNKTKNDKMTPAVVEVELPLILSEKYSENDRRGLG